MTVRRVAELAGVSIATVSWVINGHVDVSSRTRESVQRVIREHGYPAGPRSRTVRADQTRADQTRAGRTRGSQIRRRARAWAYTDYTQLGWPLPGA